MTALTSELISTTVQIAIVFLIALAVYGLAGRKRGAFLPFVGLTKAPGRSYTLALLLAAAGLIGAHAIPGFMDAAKSPMSVIGKATANGVTPVTLGILTIMAVFKTAFAEELLFRGIIGKRMITWLGFHTGNFIQAALFGAIHLLMFLSPEVQASPLRPEYVVAFTGVSGWLTGYINEKVAGGSILPGWLAHAATNFITYIGIALGVIGN
jgi:membrane protease YdiL (CAAX protease family)